MAKKRDLTVAEYLCHMGQSVVTANVKAMEALRDPLVKDSLDAEMKIGEHVVRIDGASLIPEGWIGLDELEIECESDVTVSHDKNGEPLGLAISMSRGLLKKKMHVKFRAKFSRRGTVEGIEILRDSSNDALRQALKAQNITTNVTKPKDE